MMDNSSMKKEARKEINSSLKLCYFCLNRFGLSFSKTRSNSLLSFIKEQLWFIISVISICYHVFSEIIYIGITLANSPRVEEVVPLFHTFGYGALSIVKVFAIWFKRDVFGELLQELAEIWPIPPLSTSTLSLKTKSLNSLRIAHQWYFSMNVAGVWFYNVTPIAIYCYQLWQGEDAKMGFVWVSWYPFDKHHTVGHVVAYIFEVFAGQTCVWIMVGTDLLLTAMASHICMLLRLLHKRIRAFGSDDSKDMHYTELVDIIKLHQRLIRYCNNLESAFSFSNFINIIMSSVNICCVTFVIVLLEPFMAISNKLFLGSAVIQIGVLCWYADDIYHANSEVCTAAYETGWYKSDKRCQQALLFLIRRSQKPIAFTAMKFTTISLVTYSAILTRSYSYFALLYTMYSDS